MIFKLTIELDNKNIKKEIIKYVIKNKFSKYFKLQPLTFEKETIILNKNKINKINKDISFKKLNWYKYQIFCEEEKLNEFENKILNNLKEKYKKRKEKIENIINSIDKKK